MFELMTKIQNGNYIKIAVGRLNIGYNHFSRMNTRSVSILAFYHGIILAKILILMNFRKKFYGLQKIF